MLKQPIVQLDQEKMQKEMTEVQKREFVAKCPRKVFGFNEARKTVDIENADNCTLCEECTKFTDTLGLEKVVNVAENDYKFIFTVESTGALDVEYIVESSMKILQKKMTSLQDCLSKYSIMQQ